MQVQQLEQEQVITQEGREEVHTRHEERKTERQSTLLIATRCIFNK